MVIKLQMNAGGESHLEAITLADMVIPASKEIDEGVGMKLVKR